MAYHKGEALLVIYYLVWIFKTGSLYVGLKLTL